MKYMFKTKRKWTFKIKISQVIALTFILIGIITFFFLHTFSKKTNDTLINIASGEINKVTYKIITDKINNKILNKETLKNILNIHKNKNDEILYVDFNLDQAYKVLDSVSNIITNSFEGLENGDIDVTFKDEDLTHKVNGLVLNIPVGSSLNSMIFFNMGPKIPVKINFIGTVLTNLETKVTNYGLNNALVEVFVYIEFHNQVITPFEVKDMSFKYDAIIASEMIQGTVPNFYNGVLENQSNIYQKELSHS